MPEPPHVLETRREAVHGDQGCRSASFSSSIEFGHNTIVIGLEDPANARERVTFARADISNCNKFRRMG
jgi:hypothetical protein